MQNVTVGDLAQSLILSRQGESLKTSLQRLSTEATTGLVADQTQRLKGNYAPIAGIEASLTQLEAYHSVTSETQIYASLMQTALGSVIDQSSKLGTALISGASSQSSVQINALGQDAAQRLETVISALNTKQGDRSLFSGQSTEKQALASADSLLTALQAAVTNAGAVSSGDVEAAVTAWFADPAGFQATVYQGGAVLDPVAVGTDQTAQIDVTAMDPAILATLKGVAMGALLSRGVLAGSDVARVDLAKRAGESLASAQTGITQVSARLGTTEATIQNTATRNDAEKDVLQTARLNLLSVDPYETASKFQEAQGQLQTLYAITARASRLKLVDFL
jgi:flagellar hook-associated protein 3 FlgL